MGCINANFDITEEIISSLNELRALAGLQGGSPHELNNLPLIQANPKTILHLTKYHHANAAATFGFLAQAHRCINIARQAPSCIRLAVLDQEQKWAPGDDAAARRRSIEKKLSLVEKSRWALRAGGGVAKVMAVVSLVVLAAVGIQLPVDPAVIDGINSVQTSLDTKLQRWKKELNRERDLVRSGEDAWLGIMSRLETIRVLWESVMVELEMVSKDVEPGDSIFGLEEELRVVEESINELEEEVERCNTMIKAVVTEFFNKVMNG